MILVTNLLKFRLLKVVIKKAYHFYNICNDHLNVSFNHLSGRQSENYWHHLSCIMYFHLHSQLQMNRLKLIGKVSA